MAVQRTDETIPWHLQDNSEERRRGVPEAIFWPNKRSCVGEQSREGGYSGVRGEWPWVGGLRRFVMEGHKVLVVRHEAACV